MGLIGKETPLESLHLSNGKAHTGHSPRKRWRSGLNPVFAEKEIAIIPVASSGAF